MTALLLDHLWQSTLFAAAVIVIMPLFRGNSAAVRFWLWFAASVKFLIPVSILTLAGRTLLAPVAPAIPAQLVSALQPVAIPFSGDAPVLAVAPHLMLIDLITAAWFLGSVAVLALWLLRSLRLRVHLREASDLSVSAAVPVKSTRSILEPGLVGIWRPVILLPEGIAEQLSPRELAAVMAHELCHLRRRDNLLAALHMLVEALFWFHPLVWWLGSRLMEEREYACDESVLAAGNQPLAYAEGILKICRLYIQSPLACVSGISGAALEARVGAILRNRPVDDVEGAKTALLISGAALSVMLPLLAGGMGSNPVAHIATRVVTAVAVQTDQVGLVAATVPETRSALHKPSPHRARRHAVFVPPSIPEAIVPGEIAAVPPSPAAVTQTEEVPAPANVSVITAPDDPAAIVCRRPQYLPGSRLSGPRVCRSESEWAQLRAQGRDIGADGRTIVDADDWKFRSISRRPCIPNVAASNPSVAIMCF